jgi:hypothetical protein
VGDASNLQQHYYSALRSDAVASIEDYKDEFCCQDDIDRPLLLLKSEAMQGYITTSSLQNDVLHWFAGRPIEEISNQNRREKAERRGLIKSARSTNRWVIYMNAWRQSSVSNIWHRGRVSY